MAGSTRGTRWVRGRVDVQQGGVCWWLLGVACWWLVPHRGPGGCSGGGECRVHLQFGRGEGMSHMEPGPVGWRIYTVEVQ